MDEVMNKMFGKVASGMCRLSVNGDIAIKSGNTYKTYDPFSNKLVNCNNFVFDIGDDIFFVVPTNKVRKGDIIIASGKPKCVISANEDKTITVMNYEDSTIQTLVPERHMFMGNMFFYGRIMSMFGNLGGKKSAHGKMMKYWMIAEMMKGNSGFGHIGSGNSMGIPLPAIMMMNGGFEDMFDGVFDLDEEDEDADESEQEKPAKPAKKARTAKAKAAAEEEAEE